MKFTQKNRGLLIKAAAAAFTLIVAVLVLDVYFVAPYLQSQNNSYATAQLILSDGSVINLDSRDAVSSSASVIAMTGSGNGITSSVGAVISKLNTNLYMTPSFSGSIQDYTITSKNNFDVQVEAPNGQIVYQGSIVLQPLHPTLVNGQPAIICSATSFTTGTPFTTAYLAKGTTYTLRDDISSVTIQGTFSDGTPFSASSQAAHLEWKFTYTG